MARVLQALDAGVAGDVFKFMDASTLRSAFYQAWGTNFS